MFFLYKACGYKLQLDDPSALKTIVDRSLRTVEQQQQSTTSSNETPLSNRLQFMLDTLNEMKRNKQKKDLQEEHVKYTEVNRIVKQLQLEFDRQGDHTLRVSYADFLHAKQNGRWWLVGTAWIGRQNDEVPKREGEEEQQMGHEYDEEQQEQQDEVARALQGIDREKLYKLEQLAKEQRLTTELKRVIFCIIMSAEDAVDACQSLAKLGLKKNDREIVRIIVHCCIHVRCNCSGCS